MKNFIERLRAALDAGEDIVLATVTGQSGSTPRMAGARMAVHRDGHIIGTIGGGSIEALAIAEAERCFTSATFLRRSFDLADGAATDIDMICGGKVDLCLQLVTADASTRAIFRDLSRILADGGGATLACPLDGGEILLYGDRDQETPAPFLLPAKSGAVFAAYEGREYLVAPFAAGGRLVLVGAGHVAARVAETAGLVGFVVTVMDDRAVFANRGRFPTAEEVIVLPSFADCFTERRIGPDSFIVIVTRGHAFDMTALEQALNTDAGYIGMIGSRVKRRILYAKLLERGASAARLEQVHCPVGLEIAADTPEEIAVSIVAQLIRERAARRRQ
ncbi:MAG: XdhC family protein [Desulfobulbaceae bacterium]|jgi:xanthine dehydrogenase accessory factor|nr:XdhC family protein [Desulfobulbaceae bacterium]